MYLKDGVYGIITEEYDANNDDWIEHKILNFDDTYTFDDRYGFTDDDGVDYIQRDLKLVAGGGYNWDHIHNVTFEIKEV